MGAHLFCKLIRRSGDNVSAGEMPERQDATLCCSHTGSPSYPSFPLAFPPAALLPVRRLAGLFERLAVAPLLSSMTRSVFPLTVDTR